VTGTLPLAGSFAHGSRWWFELLDLSGSSGLLDSSSVELPGPPLSRSNRAKHQHSDRPPSAKSAWDWTTNLSDLPGTLTNFKKEITYRMNHEFTALLSWKVDHGNGKVREVGTTPSCPYSEGKKAGYQKKPAAKAAKK
jgi:hypothetical protein